MSRFQNWLNIEQDFSIIEVRFRGEYSSVRGNEDDIFDNKQGISEESLLAPVFEALMFLGFLALILCTNI